MNHFLVDSCCGYTITSEVNSQTMATVGIPAKRRAECDRLRSETEHRQEINRADAESLTAAIRGGDVERVCPDSPWDRDAHL